MLTKWTLIRDTHVLKELKDAHQHLLRRLGGVTQMEAQHNFTVFV